MRRSLACSFFAMLLLLIGGVLSDARAEVVDNVLPPFRITIPEGFTARRDQNKSDQIVTYHRAGLTAGDVGVIVAVDRLRGTIGRERPSLGELTKMGQADATIEPGKWRSFDVWIVRQTQDVGGHPLVFFLVQIPLKPEAIQLKVATDAKNEAEARAILGQVLGTVEGETNWLTDGQRSRKLGEGVGRLVVIAMILLVVAFFVVRKLRA